MTFEEIKALSGSIGLILFVVVFVAVVIYTFRPGTKKQMDEHANIPLNEDKDNG